MWVSCMLRSGLLCATLSLAIAKHQPSQSSFTQPCHSRELLSQAVDTFYVKAAWLKATIPEDRIKNIRLLKKETKKLFMKNCRFQEQLLSFFMEDVFGGLQLQICKEIGFVEDFHSLRQKLSRCVSMPGKCGEFEPRKLPKNSMWEAVSIPAVFQKLLYSTKITTKIKKKQTNNNNNNKKQQTTTTTTRIKHKNYNLVSFCRTQRKCFGSVLNPEIMETWSLILCLFCIQPISSSY
ncbi:interleukin 26, transcript variant X1 [Ictidomys tridecemlineatus]|nr:interleukin 26, transcript variant X1 [Ictidomys tridecemlineatus]